MDLMPNVHFNKDQLIFEEGYPAESVYLVCDGAVQVFKKRQNKQIKLATLSKDAIFGEMAFISERPRSASVMASEDTWCYSINKDSFINKLNSADPIIITIFHDLVDTIRDKSNAAVIIDHGNIHDEEPLDQLDELAAIEKRNKYLSITPQHSYEYLTRDPKILAKVEEMDFFMRKLYSSLVNIACK